MLILQYKTGTGSTPDFTNFLTLDNPNDFGSSANDEFGQSVGISNNYAIVGAPAEDAGSGRAYIFDVLNGTLLHTLDNPNEYGAAAGDNFGWAVAVNSTNAIVTARSESAPGGGGNSGLAYIYNAATGGLIHTVENPNAFGTRAGDQFGSSVAISSTRAIVSAFTENDAGGLSSGKAYIISLATGNPIHTLDNPNAFGTSPSDRFGFSVGLSDNYAIVSSRDEGDAGGTGSGKAYIFNAASGALLHTLDNPNDFGTSADDNFGQSVAISDTYAIVGAHREDDTSVTGSGRVYIFNSVTGALVHTINNPSPNTSDFFGETVAISDNYAIVGARGDDGTGTDSGIAYIFNPATGALVETLNNPNAFGSTVDDRFGFAVGVSNSRAIVSAIREDDSGGNESGKAYIFG